MLDVDGGKVGAWGSGWSVSADESAAVVGSRGAPSVGSVGCSSEIEGKDAVVDLRREVAFRSGEEWEAAASTERRQGSEPKRLSATAFLALRVGPASGAAGSCGADLEKVGVVWVSVPCSRMEWGRELVGGL